MQVRVDFVVTLPDGRVHHKAGFIQTTPGTQRDKGAIENAHYQLVKLWKGILDDYDHLSNPKEQSCPRTPSKAPSPSEAISSVTRRPKL